MTTQKVHVHLDLSPEGARYLAAMLEYDAQMECRLAEPTLVIGPVFTRLLAAVNRSLEIYELQKDVAVAEETAHKARVKADRLRDELSLRYGYPGKDRTKV